MRRIKIAASLVAALLLSVWAGSFFFIEETFIVKPEALNIIKKPPVKTAAAPTVYIPQASLDDFARCLFQKGMKMYGVDACGYCAEQKKYFGASFSFINYVNCDTQAIVCQQKGIRLTPTWESGDGQMYLGMQSLSRLGQIAGCPILLL